MKTKIEREKPSNVLLLVEDRLSGISGTENVTTETRLSNVNERTCVVHLVRCRMQIIITREDKRPSPSEWAGRSWNLGNRVNSRKYNRDGTSLEESTPSFFLSVFLALSSCTLLPVARLSGTAPQPRFLISPYLGARACDLTWPSDGISWISSSPNRYPDVRRRSSCSFLLLFFYFWKIFRGFSVNSIDSYYNIVLQYYVLIRGYYNIILYCNTILYYTLL